MAMAMTDEAHMIDVTVLVLTEDAVPIAVPITVVLNLPTVLETVD